MDRKTRCLIGLMLLNACLLVPATGETQPDPEVAAAQKEVALKQAELAFLKAEADIEELRVASQLRLLKAQREAATFDATVASQTKTEREAIFGKTLEPRERTIKVSSSAEAMAVAQDRFAETAQIIAGLRRSWHPPGYTFKARKSVTSGLRSEA